VRIDLLIEQQPSVPPWKSMLRRQNNPGEHLMVPWNRVADDDDFYALLHWNFSSALFWGAYHPAEFKNAFRAEHAASLAALPGAKTAGLAVPAGWKPPELNEFIAESKAFVRRFEETIRPLVPVPPELAESPMFAMILA
jgi:hypothetical protein